MIKTTVNTVVKLSTGNGNDEVLPANERRIGLIISFNTTGVSWWRFGEPMSAAQQGHPGFESLNASLFPPIKITYNDFGTGMQQPLNVYTTTPNKVVVITEFLAAP